MTIVKVGTGGINNNVVTNAQIAVNTITTDDIEDSVVTATKLAAGAGRTDWQSVVTGDTTMATNKGYFVNTTGGAITMTLPSSPSIGDFVELKDYLKTWDSNKVTLARNGSKIQGTEIDGELTDENGSVKVVFSDSTRGWLIINSDTPSSINQKFISATGGSVTTVCTNFKVHTFTSSGCFVVSCGGNAGGSNSVDYLVIAGGASGGRGGGGGGAGGVRESNAATQSYQAIPGFKACGAIPVSACTTYPITVGAGGAGNSSGRGEAGSTSTFSSISSAGGGGGGGFPSSPSANEPGIAGGSGGGAGGTVSSGTAPGGAGNTPPVTPSQGNRGSNVTGPVGASGAGGGIGAAGADSSTNPGQRVAGQNGGGGETSDINGSEVVRGGGGGGGGQAFNCQSAIPGGSGSGGGAAGGSSSSQGGCGTANTGGGGGGGGRAHNNPSGSNGGAGGSGLVIIRYKFQ